MRPPERRDITSDARGFRALVRNEAFRWVLLFARRDFAELSACTDPDRLASEERRPAPVRTAGEIEQVAAGYWAEHAEVHTGPDARGPEFFDLDDDWRRSTAAVRQVIRDPAGFDEWSFHGFVDLERSREWGRPVVVLEALRRPS